MASTDDQSSAQARRQSNLAFAFKIAGLDAPRQRAMEIFYTFCRVVDDIVDEPGNDTAKHAALDAWRSIIHGYFNGTAGAPAHDALAAELGGVVRDYAVPLAPLLEIVDGCAMDIGPREYATAGELHRYCHGVACAVGLVSIRIFGCKNPLSETFAEALGYALQFTNILRDVVEDYHELGRVYLPRDEMAAFGVTSEMLADPRGNTACLRLFRLQYFRAKHYFNKARRLVAPEDRDALRAAFVMGAFYEAILEKIRADGFQLTRRRTRISRWKKLLLLRRTLRELRKPQVLLKRPLRVAVIGGGVAGIAAAAEAALAGHAVDLYEARPAWGGRAGSFVHTPTGAELDHGHHAMFGCYHAFLRLADTLGVREKLDFAPRLEVPYRAANGRTSLLRAGKTAPLHLAWALLQFSEISWRDRRAIARFGAALRLGRGPHSGETAADWLARLGQTAGAIRALWEPFAVAALNTPLARADAALLAETLRRTLFGGVANSAIVTSKTSLGALFATEVPLYLRAIGGAAHTGKTVRELVFESGTAAAIRLGDGTTATADAFILATPWKAAASLLPSESPLAKNAAQITGEPILNLHLFTRKKIFNGSFHGLLDSPWQWIFDRTGPGTPEGLFRYALTMSCPGEWMKFDSAEIIARTRAALEKLFPETAPLEVAHALVCKYPNATFSATPASAPLRPGAVTPWKNLFLAGDWTDTGLPATLEGAAQSGQRVAREIG